MKTSPDPGAEAPPPGLPNILDYTDYRKFLADHYRARKAVDPSFSLRVFARKAGFPSHGLLKYLMEGQRNLTQKTLVKILPALDFDREQARYFENLVFFNQAKGLGEQQVYYDRLREASAATFRKLEVAQLAVFRAWHYTVIREMLALKGFRADADWIAARLKPRVEAREARAALDTLIEAGLIVRKAGGYRAAEPDITTGDEVRSFAVKNYHAEMMRLATLALDHAPGERDISASTFALRSSDWPRLKKRVQAMRKELREFAARSGEGDRIIQVNLQVFPLTQEPA
jgi:uncharacterized protein (TIGR02147 family)